MIRKVCKDEFNFLLMDAEEYNDFERNTTANAFSMRDVQKYIGTKAYGNDKDFMNLDHFSQWLKSTKSKANIDLIYFLFHTMLVKKSVKRTLDRGQKVITMVTVFPVLRPIFVNSGGQGSKNYEMARAKFLEQANKCRAILANNQKSLDDLKKIYNGKKFLAPRGVNPDIFYPMTEVFHEKPEKQFTIAFCGKPNPEKGLKSIIKPACIEAGVKLITNERNFEDALPEHKMREFYNSADAYIVASTMDGTPNTALEAASCGKPILSNAIGNMPEFIKKGENGWIVDLDKDRYVHRLRYMKKNQKKVFQMGLNARETILRDWTWHKVINSNERQIFRKVINGV